MLSAADEDVGESPDLLVQGPGRRSRPSSLAARRGGTYLNSDRPGPVAPHVSLTPFRSCRKSRRLCAAYAFKEPKTRGATPVRVETESDCAAPSTLRSGCRHNAQTGQFVPFNEVSRSS